jgi:hypothetical protein
MALKPESPQEENDLERGLGRAILEALNSNSKTARLILILLALSHFATAAR